MRSPLHRSAAPLSTSHLSRTLATLLLLAGAAPALAQPFVKDGQSRTITTWAAKGLMQNPVSICFDPHGNLYVAETDRAGNAVTDTRGLGHLNAVEEDLKFKSIEDRRDEIHRWIKQGAFAPDFFTKTEDRVRIVRDTDGDGVADAASVFAGGFNGELDGIGAGVLWHNDKLYYTCIPDLWMLTPGKDPLVSEKRESLAHGYGVRWCFYGHDLHGLTLGPDGRIYFSMGDRGFNVTTKEGNHLIGPDRGGVFRCWPDGSNLELFYQGLRNPQELAFNEVGELFTGDNNCDSGDSARVVHVVEGGDSGWRQDVQSLESRGPWNREAMWKRLADVSGPARPAWSLPPIEHMGAGPSGIALYPGTGESSKYEGCLFLVDFYGSGSTVHAFRPTPDGAGYKVSDHVEYYRGVTVTDIAFGYDGRLYMSDWGGGWEPNPNGTVLVAKNDTVRADAAESAAITQVQELFKAGFRARPVDELLGLLGHRDQRVRLNAQYELAARAASGAAPAATLADSLASLAAQTSGTAFKRYHALWAIGQIARSQPAVGTRLVPLLADPDAEIRAQAAKTIGDLRGEAFASATPTLIAMLKDASPRARFYAAQALGKLGVKNATLPLLQLLDATPQTDPTLRHAASCALSLIGDADQMLAKASGMGPGARLGTVVALRRMNHPAAGNFLRDADAAVAVESVRAIYDLRLAASMPALAQLLDAPIPADRAIEPLMRRAIEANQFLGTDDCVARLAAFAARTDAPADWRLLALQRVAGWNKPLKREGVWGNWADYPAHSEEALAAAVRATIEPLIASAGDSAPLAALAQQLKAAYALNLSPEQMLAELSDTGKPDDYRRVLLDRVAGSSPDRLGEAAQAVLAHAPKGALRARAEELLVRASPGPAVEYLTKATAAGDPRDRQRAVKLLGQIDSDAARAALSELADRMTTGLLSPVLSLEVYDAAMKQPPDSPARARAEAVGRQGIRPPGFSTALLSAGGDPAAGREVFLHNTSAECLRCHLYKGTGGTAGPELTNVAARLPIDKLVESVVEPSAVVASGYGTVSAMPQMTQILNPHQVRDVVAFLSTLKPAAKGGSETPAGGHGAVTAAADTGSHADSAQSPGAAPTQHSAARGGQPSHDAGNPWISRLLAIVLIPVTLVVMVRSLARRPAP